MVSRPDPPYRTDRDDFDGVVVTVLDITDRKETETELRERIESLEAELQAQTRRVREVSAELVRAEQEERDRISNILHDELQQELHAVQMCVEAVEDEVPSERDDLLDRMRETLETAIEQTRTLAKDLSPPVLEADSFVDVLERLALRMEENHGLTVEVVTHTSCQVRDEEMYILLFRSARELLFNVVKHAEVDEAQLRCHESDDEQLTVAVIEEGGGFDVDALEENESRGFGLYRVRKRLNMFGGHLELESAPGEGTHATMVLPVGDSDDA